MKSKKWDWITLSGVLCFVVGALLMVLGQLATPWQYTLPVLGLILIGAGTSGKRHTP